MKSECESILKKLTGKKHVFFVRRGNAAILASLKFARDKSFDKVLIQDQGGWITYPQFVLKLKMQEVRLKTDYGLLSQVDEKDAVLLLNSMPGYHALQDLDFLKSLSENSNLFVINDVSGSVGTGQAMIGDMIIGSFGKWKPLDLEEGGFVACDYDVSFDFFREFEVEFDFEKLHQKLLDLKEKLLFFDMIHNKIVHDLSDYDVVHKDAVGINVIVKFSSEAEKEKLIKYCNENNYEFVECPRYIRILEQAISIEVKRLNIVR
ncbi:MAG: hypothetical protein KKF89_01860 [Nanoarchaeota archaeon]|nr:hypothetical protein [Nanoarchaeota archaeon]MBU1854443.1 hypothetical protein [Nanoarchaeota archaeon]